MLKSRPLFAFYLVNKKGYIRFVSEKWSTIESGNIKVIDSLY